MAYFFRPLCLNFRKSGAKLIFIVVVLISLWHFYNSYERGLKKIKKPIPQIIHQMWKTEKIPAMLHPMIKSWERNHPDWQYWFWTDENIWDLVQKKFPSYMGLFTSYNSDIERADVARYMIMYEYGGVYMDLDVESLKPLDDLVVGYPCILGEEPWVHARLFDKVPRIVSNAALACIPKHPFFLHVLQNLQNNRETPTNSIVWRTGPHMITQELSNFNKKPRDPYDVNRMVHVLDYEVFFPVIEPIKMLRMKPMCTEKRELEPIQIGACKALKKMDYKFEIGPNSYTNHHWMASYRKPPPPSSDDTIIPVIVPRVKRKFDFQK